MKLYVNKLVYILFSFVCSLGLAQMPPVITKPAKLEIETLIEASSLSLDAPRATRTSLRSLNSRMEKWGKLTAKKSLSPQELEQNSLEVASYLQTILALEGSSRRAKQLRALLETFSARLSVVAKDEVRRNRAQLYYAISSSADERSSKDWPMLEKLFEKEKRYSSVIQLQIA